jgi:hypothetical protein
VAFFSVGFPSNVFPIQVVLLQVMQKITAFKFPSFGFQIRRCHIPSNLNLTAFSFIIRGFSTPGAHCCYTYYSAAHHEIKKKQIFTQYNSNVTFMNPCIVNIIMNTTKEMQQYRLIYYS